MISHTFLSIFSNKKGRKTFTYKKIPIDEPNYTIFHVHKSISLRIKAKIAGIRAENEKMKKPIRTYRLVIIYPNLEEHVGFVRVITGHRKKGRGAGLPFRRHGRTFQHGKMVQEAEGRCSTSSRPANLLNTPASKMRTDRLRSCNHMRGCGRPEPC